MYPRAKPSKNSVRKKYKSNNTIGYLDPNELQSNLNQNRNRVPESRRHMFGKESEFTPFIFFLIEWLSKRASCWVILVLSFASFAWNLRNSSWAVVAQTQCVSNVPQGWYPNIAQYGIFGGTLGGVPPIWPNMKCWGGGYPIWPNIPNQYDPIYFIILFHFLESLFRYSLSFESLFLIIPF